MNIEGSQSRNPIIYHRQKTIINEFKRLVIRFNSLFIITSTHRHSSIRELYLILNRKLIRANATEILLLGGDFKFHILPTTGTLLPSVFSVRSRDFTEIMRPSDDPSDTLTTSHIPYYWRRHRARDCKRALHLVTIRMAKNEGITQELSVHTRLDILELNCEVMQCESSRILCNNSPAKNATCLDTCDNFANIS